MLKLFTTFVLSTLVGITIAQDYQSDKFSTRLLEVMQQRTIASTDVYVVLTDQIDIDGLIDSFNTAGTPVKERAVIINKKLRSIANRSQGAVLNKLEQLDIQEVIPMWVVNALFFRATQEELAIISQLDNVKFLDLDAPLLLDEPYEQVMDESPRSSEGRKEPGLEIIQAPKMWAKGYTGYGTKAFVMDTGVDPTHPALSRNYAGHVVPADQAWFGPTGRHGRPYDCQSHGTHCTGTVLGIDREQRDTIGVAFNAMWMGAPILLVCNGSTALRMAGFQWSMDPDNNPDTTDDMPDVINNSWSDTMVEDCYEVYEQLLTTVDAAGIAIVFASGNNGPGSFTISNPQNINKTLVNTFAVGAIDGSNLNIADFSGRGPSRCEGEGSLLIKPEVSAPGVAIRSCVPGNAYANFSGTSMAAPHAAGAILLLKEAFPYLSGEAIKLALYFSAVDMGEPGEDNIFGMGMIDIDAAFDYLVNEGHVPVSPHAAVDLNLETFNIDLKYCSGEVLFSAVLTNNGAEAIHGFKLEVFSDENSTDPFSVIENGETLPVGERLEWTSSIPVPVDGVYNMMARVWPTTQLDEKPLNNSVRLFFIYNQTDDIELNIDQNLLDQEWCGDTKLLLENNIDSGITLWYQTVEASTPLFEGNQYLLQLPNADTTLHFHLGFKLDNKFFDIEQVSEASEIIPEKETGIVFSTRQNVFFSSFSLNCTARTFLNLQLVADDGRVFWSSNRFYNAGENIIPVNTHLPGNQDIRLVVTANRALMAILSDQLYTDSYIAFDFPLVNNETSDELVSVFYDVEISYDVPCAKKPISITVKAVEEAPLAAFSTLPEEGNMAVLQEILFVNESENASSFEWNFGDGNSAVEELPTHSYTAAGTYLVKLLAIDDNGCQDIFLRAIVVEDDESTSIVESSLDSKLDVYPNPASNEIHIVSEQDEINRIHLIGIDGRVIPTPIQSGTSNNFRIDLRHLNPPPGFYILKAFFGDGSIGVARVIIQ